jgi:hypothetical protein
MSRWAEVILRTAVVLFGLCDDLVRYGTDELEDVKVVLDTGRIQREFHGLPKQARAPQSFGE